MDSTRVTLNDLAQFTVAAVESGPDGTARLAGFFTHLKGVREGRGWLYVSRTDSIVGALATLDATNMTAVFVVSQPKAVPRVGDKFPYLRGNWNTADIARVLEGEECWRRIVFQASDAVEFRDPKHPGSIIQRPVNDENDHVPDGSQSVRIREAGWDHEHCRFCMAKIGHGGAAHGYKSVEGRWLCEDCYAKYVVQRDLSFLHRKG
jgi:hypothetical protein